MINVERQFVGTCLRSSELEEKARAIVIMAQASGDVWHSFTVEEYAAFWKCAANADLVSNLDELVSFGVLDKNNGFYAVNDKFIQMLEDWIKY